MRKREGLRIGVVPANLGIDDIGAELERQIRFSMNLTAEPRESGEMGTFNIYTYVALRARS